MARGPYLPNLDPIIQAGIDPKTGLPVKVAGASGCGLKDAIKKQLRILDEQNAINRFTWYNLPSGLTGQMLERILYYKGQAAFFYMEADDQFYFLPYALDGTIDVYGRFKGITPVPFAGGTTSDGKAKPFVVGMTKKPVYNIEDVFNEEVDVKDCCVLLSDYSKQYSQTVIARQLIQDPVLDAMAEAFPMARTSLIANSGIKGMRVNDEDQQAQVKAASRSLTNAALSGDPWVPFVGQVEFQDFTSDGSAMKAEEYLLYLQSMDNYRLSLYGLKNGGLFQKKSQVLQAEEDVNQGNIGLIMQDSLTLRQEFCDMVNALFGLGIWVEPSETILNIDRNNNGSIEDDKDQSGMYAGDQPEEVSYE